MDNRRNRDDNSKKNGRHHPYQWTETGDQVDELGGPWAWTGR
jgi:hypothetical protein